MDAVTQKGIEIEIRVALDKIQLATLDLEDDKERQKYYQMSNGRKLLEVYLTRCAANLREAQERILNSLKMVEDVTHWT